MSTFILVDYFYVMSTFLGLFNAEDGLLYGIKKLAIKIIGKHF